LCCQLNHQRKTAHSILACRWFEIQPRRQSH
jgi:hypothetical protein